MYCPKCPETALFRKEAADQGFEIDLCSRCGGIWFDYKELTKVLGTRAQPLDRVPTGSVLQELHPCPKCKEGMYTFCYPETLTMVEMCANCLGMFLDRREWKKIHEARQAVIHDVTCPKCHHEQVKKEACFACGYIFPDTQPKYVETARPATPLEFREKPIGFIQSCIEVINPFD